MPQEPVTHCTYNRSRNLSDDFRGAEGEPAVDSRRVIARCVKNFGTTPLTMVGGMRKMRRMRKELKRRSCSEATESVRLKKVNHY